MENSIDKYFDYLNQIKKEDNIRQLQDNDLPIVKRKFILNELSNVLHYLRAVDSYDTNEINTSSNQLNQTLKRHLSHYFKELIKLSCEFYGYDNIVRHSKFLLDNYIITENDINYNDELNQLLFVTNELFEVSLFGYLDEMIDLFIMFDQKYNLL